jgi:hypothetical protein
MTNPETFKPHVNNLKVLLSLSACLCMTLMLVYRMGPSIVDPDIWHEMALIRTTLDLGFIPYQDSFAYTETIYPSVHHEWAAGLIAYSLSSYFGAAGIVIFRYLLTFILISSLIYSLKKCKVKFSIILFFLPIPIFLWGYGASTVRAQMYSFVFTAFLLIFLDSDNRGHRWWIPIWLVLFTMWLNLHGGFLVGLGLIAAYCIEQISRNKPYKHIIVVILIMIVLIVVNPYGIHYYPYLLNAVTMKRPHISEWNSILTGSSLAELLFFIISLLLSGYALWKQGFKNTKGIFLLLITAIVSIKSNRLLPFYAILWIYFVPLWIQTTSLGKNVDNIYRNRKFFLIGFYLIVSIFLGFKILQFTPWSLQVPNSKRSDWGEHTIYPVGAVEYLRLNGFKGNILVPFDWGAYIIWKLHPNVKVSLDSRYEVAYPKQVFNEQYDLYMGAQNWTELLKKYAPDIILTHERLPLTKLIDSSVEWKIVYKDHQWNIYAKHSSDLPYEVGPSNFYSGKFP